MLCYYARVPWHILPMESRSVSLHWALVGHHRITRIASTAMKYNRTIRHGRPNLADVDCCLSCIVEELASRNC